MYNMDTYICIYIHTHTHTRGIATSFSNTCSNYRLHSHKDRAIFFIFLLKCERCVQLCSNLQPHRIDTLFNCQRNYSHLVVLCFQKSSFIRLLAFTCNKICVKSVHMRNCVMVSWKLYTMQCAQRYIACGDCTQNRLLGGRECWKIKFTFSN